MPRGTSVLGFAQYLPNENVLLTKEQLMDRVCAILGGRAAEQVRASRVERGTGWSRIGRRGQGRGDGG